MSTYIRPPAVVSFFIRAANNSDLKGLLTCFTGQAMVYCNGAFHFGSDEIRKWAETELIAARITFEVDAILNHDGAIIISAVAEGDFDKENCPEPNFLDFFFLTREDHINLLIVIRNNKKSGRINRVHT